MRGSSAGNTSISKEDLLFEKNRTNSNPKHLYSVQERTDPFTNTRPLEKAIIIERQSEDEDSNIKGSIESDHSGFFGEADEAKVGLISNNHCV